MTKSPIYYDPPKTGKKIAVGLAAGAGATALVVSLSGNGDAPQETTPTTPTSSNTTLVQQGGQHAALPVLTQRAQAPSPAPSAALTMEPMLDLKCSSRVLNELQHGRAQSAAQQLQAAISPQGNDPSRAYSSLKLAIEYAAHTPHINKGVIASIPDTMLKEMGTTRSNLQATFERQSLEFAKHALESMKSRVLSYNEVKEIRMALANTAYSTPEQAAQAITIDGEQVDYNKLILTEDKLKYELLAPYLNRFQDEVKKVRESSNPDIVPFRSSVDTIINILDDGRTPPQMVEQQFMSITGMGRKDMGDFIGQHEPGYKVHNGAVHMEERNKRDAITAVSSAGCWTDHVTHGQNAATAPQPRR